MDYLKHILDRRTVLLYVTVNVIPKGIVTAEESIYNPFYSSKQDDNY